LGALIILDWSPYKKKRRQRHMGRRVGDDGAQLGVMWPQAKETWTCKILEEAGRICPHLDFRLQPLRTEQG
jgi:hypothetical protein